jgi:hypothetical protein
LKNAFIESQIDKDFGKIELTEDLTIRLSFAYYMMNVVNTDVKYTGCIADYKPYIAFDSSSGDTLTNSKTITISKGAYNVNYFCKLISTQMSFVNQLTPSEKQIPNTLLQETQKPLTYEVRLYYDVYTRDPENQATCILVGITITQEIVARFATGNQVELNIQDFAGSGVGYRSAIFFISTGMEKYDDETKGRFVLYHIDDWLEDQGMNFKPSLSESGTVAIQQSTSNTTNFYQQGDKSKFFNYGDFSYLFGASQAGLTVNSNSRFEFQFLHSPFYTAPNVVGTSLENGFICPSLSGICLTNLEPESLWFDEMGFSKNILTSIDDLETKPNVLQPGYNITTGFVGTNSIKELSAAMKGFTS